MIRTKSALSFPAHVKELTRSEAYLSASGLRTSKARLKHALRTRTSLLKNLELFLKYGAGPSVRIVLEFRRQFRSAL